MLSRYRVLSLSAAAVLLPILFVASTASGAPHDGPGPGCVTHIGATYVSGGRVYSEGSGGCNSSADRSDRHDMRHDIQESRWWGWNGVGYVAHGGLWPPFSVWLPMNRPSNCPRNYRGQMKHYSETHGANERYTNTTSC